MNVNAFEGIELIPFQLKQLRKQVDYVSCTYQEKSYWGNPIKEKDLELLFRLKKEGLVDTLLNFKVDKVASSVYEAKETEKQKRNYAKKYYSRFGFSHILELDSDEFFIEEEFKKAKKYIIDNKIDYSACQFYNYMNEPTIRSKKISTSIIPFICKLDERIELQGAQFLGRCDPTRSYNIDKEILLNNYLFTKEELVMHHFSNVRKDLFHKYNSTSLAGLDRERLNEMIKTIQSIDENNLILNSNFKNLGNDRFEVVENLFNIIL